MYGSILICHPYLQCFGSFGAAAFLISLAYVDCEHPVLAVTLLSLGIAITACNYTGYIVNYMDIAPQFAGTLFGLGNGIAASTGFLAPYTVAVLTVNQTQEEWYFSCQPESMLQVL